MLLTRLRAETAELHAAVERRLGVMDPHLTPAGYADTLAAFHGFHAAWEPAVRTAAAASPVGPAVLDLMASRWRLPALAADLAHLGLDPAAVAPATADDGTPAVPRLDPPGRLLGSLYVMEGSTLGGVLVARHLERTLGLAGGVGYAYFCGHGDQAGPRWRAFAARLTELAASLPPGGDDDAVAGAADTFRALDGWLARPRAAVGVREEAGGRG
ncbi:MAG: bphO [Phycisphaerales bacterium]|nr:bphO [Phycisphaerales bacterium]